MKPEKSAHPTLETLEPSRRFFTVASANRALVLVRRIVEDIVRNHRELMQLRDRRDEIAGKPGASEEADALRAQIEARIATLEDLHGELTDIGCTLKDWAAGLVDFPALHHGRPVNLCWKLGEERVAHWHELTAGFAGRQPIGPDFDDEAV
ncbi:MAG: DUF2203 family protein [Planctomycetota bacterium]|nr:MAG: DUF2203 family protein [Planctomycetota bacterium]